MHGIVMQEGGLGPPPRTWPTYSRKEEASDAFKEKRLSLTESVSRVVEATNGVFYGRDHGSVST